MLRNVLCAAVLVAVSFGLALADQVKGKITKIDGDKITLTTSPDTKAGTAGGETKTFDLDKNVKVVKGKNRESVAGGLKAPELSNIGPKGVNATVEVSGNKVTEIILATPKKNK